MDLVCLLHPLESPPCKVFIGSDNLKIRFSIVQSIAILMVDLHIGRNVQKESVQIDGYDLSNSADMSGRCPGDIPRRPAVSRMPVIHIDFSEVLGVYDRDEAVRERKLDFGSHRRLLPQ